MSKKHKNHPAAIWGRQQARKRWAEEKAAKLALKALEEEQTKTIYRYRAIDLRKLGFKSYETYLKSDLWARITSIVRPPGTKCRLCKGKWDKSSGAFKQVLKDATQIHHRSYSLPVLAGEDLTPLVPVCSRCHTEIEFVMNGRHKVCKRTFAGAQKECRRRMRVRRVPDPML